MGASRKTRRELSPEERRVAGLLHYGKAKLEMFRVFNSAPPPGPARERLHESALSECMAVVRILDPLATEDPHIDDVGMMFWATNSLADYYLKGGAADLAVEYAEEAVNITRDAARLDPGEPEYRRWWASGLAHLAEAQAAADKHPAAITSLDSSLNILRELQDELPMDGRRKDLQVAIEFGGKDIRALGGSIYTTPAMG